MIARILSGIALTLWCCTALQTYGQNSNQSLVPNVIPQAPETAALGKYGVYQVNHFTGVPEISIPLYEVTAGEISVPITLQYHASGIKVNERSSRVGLGWSIAAGGRITRKIMGLEDEHYAGYLRKPMLSSIDPYDLEDLMYVNEINRGVYDTEPDIYSYSFPGNSGNFFFDINKGYRIVKIPYSPVKILKPGILTFEIYDEKGNFFDFKGASETDNTVRGITTAWLLNQIISSNKADTIKFKFSPRSGQTNVDLSDVITVTDLVWNYSDPTFSPDLGISSVVTNGVYATEQNLTDIIHPLGKVTFESDVSDRQDGFAGQKKLNKIHIYNSTITGSYNLLKTIELHHSYFGTSQQNNKRLRLDSVSTYSSTGELISRHKFDYNTMELPDYLSKSRDYWGYYNNKGNNTLVPRMDISYQSSTTSQNTTITIGSNVLNGREPDPMYMQACMLNKITYPTGGWSEFSFETNQYLEGQTAKYAGGLRISQIRSYDGINVSPVIKTYLYGDNESGYGRANFRISDYWFQNSQHF
jgi:hypothetical protein